MDTWDRDVQKLKDKHKADPWSPYAPQSKRGFDLLAKNRGLACVLCEGLVEVKSRDIPEANGSIIIACDHESTPGAYKRITLMPDLKADGGATITPTSEYGCSRGLIKRQK